MKLIYYIIISFVFSTVILNAQTIVLDPGHGYCSDCTQYCNPSSTGYNIRSETEIKTAMVVGQKTKDLFTSSCSQATVHLTRTSSDCGAFPSLAQRAAMSNNWSADLFLSIHCNAINGVPTASGTETFYCTSGDSDTAPDIAFANLIQNNMVTDGEWKNRRCMEDKEYSGVGYHLSVLRNTSATACLSEIGFVTNPSDEAKLNNNEWRNKFAQSYYRSIKSSLNLSCETAEAPGDFTLSTVAECSGTSTRIRLNWTASANATSYDVYRDGTFYYTASSTQFTNTYVTAGQTYTYKVIAKNGGSSTTNSNGTLSETAISCNSEPGAFNVTLEAKCSNTNNYNRLDWTEATNADSYKIYRNGSYYGTTTRLYYNNWSVAAGTAYTYYVKAVNTSSTTNNANGSQTVTALNCNPTPESFTVSVEAKCSGTNNYNRLSWDASTNATSYKIYRNGSYYGTTTRLYYNNWSVVAGTSYTYKVQAVNTNGTLYNSNGNVNVTALNCNLPGTFNVSINAKCYNSNNYNKLTWETSARATSYKIYRDGSYYGSTTRLYYNNWSVAAGRSYSYTVLAVNDEGTTANSNGAVSTTALNCSSSRITNTISDKFDATEIKLYPNPTEGIVNLNVSNSKTNEIAYQIFDVTGKQLLNVTEASKNDSTNLKIDLSNFESGIYIIKISNGDVNKTERIIKK